MLVLVLVLVVLLVVLVVVLLEGDGDGDQWCTVLVFFTLALWLSMTPLVARSLSYLSKGQIDDTAAAPGKRSKRASQGASTSGCVGLRRGRLYVGGLAEELCFELLLTHSLSPRGSFEARIPLRRSHEPWIPPRRPHAVELPPSCSTLHYPQAHLEVLPFALQHVAQMVQWGRAHPSGAQRRPSLAHAPPAREGPGEREALNPPLHLVHKLENVVDVVYGSWHRD